MLDFRPTILSRQDVQRLHPLVMQAALHEVDPGLDLLDEKLANGEVVRPSHVPPNIVTMNSTVLVSHSPSGAYREVSLVYPDDANALTGAVSVLSQLGAALLGARVGDVVRVGSAGHERSVHVAAIVYQP